MKGGLGGGALALLGTLALQAFRNAGGKPKQALQLDSTQLAAGLRAPHNEQEEQEVQSVADLIVKAMVNAAKADGHIDEAEMQRITGTLEKDGITGWEQELLAAELRKPLDTDSLVRAVSGPSRGKGAKQRCQERMALPFAGVGLTARAGKSGSTESQRRWGVRC